MFKKHWKTPFRNSPYNIRQKEIQIGIDYEGNTQHFVDSIPEWDENTAVGRRVLLEQQPNTDGLELTQPEGNKLGTEEMAQEIWAACENRYNETMDDHYNFSPY